MIRKAALAVLLALSLAVGPAAGQIYENESADIDDQSWVAGAEDMTSGNVGRMLGRVGAFVIGEDPNDPVTGPLMAGIVFGFFAVGILGTSRAGLVGGGTLGVATAAVLSQSAGVAPTWVYGVVMIIVGLVASSIYIRMLR